MHHNLAAHPADTPTGTGHQDYTSGVTSLLHGVHDALELGQRQSRF